MARIRHLAIVSENRERLVKFYTEAFGLKVIDGVGPAIYLTDGYINLAIIQKRPHYEVGLYHFGIEVDNVEALGRYAASLAPLRIFRSVRRTAKPSIE
jgi:catechol-2,3-dioxygenase